MRTRIPLDSLCSLGAGRFGVRYSLRAGDIIALLELEKG
jgi:hypothetical protein